MTVGIRKDFIKKDETLPEDLTADDILKELYFKIPENNSVLTHTDPKERPGNLASKHIYKKKS